MNKSEKCIIDIGFSNDVTSDRNKFEDIRPYKSGCAKFGNDIPCIVKGKGTIQLINKIKCENVWWVEGINYNLLSVS